jgi:hypothetical protein
MNQEQNSEYYCIVVIRMEDEPIHTDTHPFCDDISCPCKEDWQRINEHITEPLLAGLLTENEAIRLYQDRQISASTVSLS